MTIYQRDCKAQHNKNVKINISALPYFITFVDHFRTTLAMK
jgi:hypothetical protein